MGNSVQDELRIIIVGYDDLASVPRDRLMKIVEDYGARILADAEGIERGRRVTPGRPMITDNAIMLADMNARNYKSSAKKATKTTIFSIFTSLATLATGAFGAYIMSPIGAAGFALCGVSGILFHLLSKNEN